MPRYGRDFFDGQLEAVKGLVQAVGHEAAIVSSSPVERPEGCDHLRLRGLASPGAGENACKAANRIQGHRLQDCFAGKQEPGSSTRAGESVCLRTVLPGIAYREGQVQNGKKKQHSMPTPRVIPRRYWDELVFS